ncbi:MAG: VCBS domain-containing protein [Aliiglaciecola sp.]|uniref:VCBS domain-containing protein n=1 Tax=Aliiglaciecola sp. TaxID=1872441 RepID=UPI0032975581
MNNLKNVFTVSALALALTACGSDSDHQLNVEGGVSISGETTSGQTLTAQVRDVNGVNESAVSYQWLSAGVAIPGATSNSYVLADSDIDSTITVTANYTDNDSFDESVVSAATEVIKPIILNVEGVVEITGTVESGQELTAVITDDNGLSLQGVSYAWLAGTDSIGTDAPTVTLTNDEVGKTVTVTVTYVDNDGFAEDVTSEATTSVAPTPPTDAEFSGDLSVTVTSNEAEPVTGTAIVTDLNEGESSFEELSDITTTYGMFSITSSGAWTYTLDTSNATVAGLTSTGDDLVDTIMLSSFDGTVTPLLITITGAELVANNILTIAGVGQVRVQVSDTEAQETDAGISTNNGKLTVESGTYKFRFNAQDVDPGGFIALFGGKSNTPRPVVELRFDEGKLFVDNNITDDLIELVQTYVEGDWNDVEITWDTALATDTIAPIVTLSINGEPVRSVDGTTITADTFDSFTNNQTDLKNGINMVKMNMLTNADDAVFQLDDIQMINNHVDAAPTVIFDADFEDLSAGDSAPEPTDEVPTGDSIFNASTDNAIVETVLEGAEGAEVVANNVVKMSDTNIDTSTGDTGNFFGQINPIVAGTPLQNGKMTFSFKVEKSATNFDDNPSFAGLQSSRVTLSGDGNARSSLLELYFDVLGDSNESTEGVIGLRNDNKTLLLDQTFTVGDWVDVAITWTGDGTVTPTLNISIDGEVVTTSDASLTITDGSFTSLSQVSDNVLGGMYGASLKLSAGANPVVGAAFYVDDVNIYSDVAGTVSVFSDDFEGFAEGTYIDGDDVTYKSNSNDAVIVTEMVQP